jgi:hypothetical protein
MKITVFWDMTSYSLVHGLLRNLFGGGDCILPVFIFQGVKLTDAQIYVEKLSFLFLIIYNMF